MVTKDFYPLLHPGSETQCIHVIHIHRSMSDVPIPQKRIKTLNNTLSVQGQDDIITVNQLQFIMCHSRKLKIFCSEMWKGEEEFCSITVVKCHANKSIKLLVPVLVNMVAEH